MNGKVARALRHAQDGTINIRDVGILSRRMASQSRQLDTQPKFTEPRYRKPAHLHSPTWPANEQQFNQSRPIIVMHPIRLIRARCAGRYTSFFNQSENFATNFEQAGWMPKHVLDRMALAS